MWIDGGMTMKEQRPWDRIEGEGDEPWAAFCAFKDMGPARSLKEVAQRTGKAYVTITKHSSKYRWFERAAFWDAEVLKTKDEATLSEVARLQRIHLRQISAIREKAFGWLERATDKDLKPSTVVMAFFDAITAERLAIGEATERTDHLGKPFDWSKYDDNEVSYLRALLARQEDGEG